MPRVIDQSITIVQVKPISISYAYEPRGNPPVATLIEIHTYDLLKANGEVYERKSVGRPCPPARLPTVSAWHAQAQAEITALEGL